MSKKTDEKEEGRKSKRRQTFGFLRGNNNEHVIEQDTVVNVSNKGLNMTEDRPKHELDERKIKRIMKSSVLNSIFARHPKKPANIPSSENSEKERNEGVVNSRSSLERLAFSFLSHKLPKLPGYDLAFAQSGIPLVYESYLSTSFFVSGMIALATFFISLIFEARLLRHEPIVVDILGSAVLGVTIFAIALFSWLSYPLQKRNAAKAKLDSQLAYSFGILGVLAASGMNVERLFERLAFSESNQVLATLAKRFLRNVRLFGMDTESALREVGEHSPSAAFAKMLESISVAFRTTGSIHDLVMFESGRLFEEKRSKLSKIIGNLGVMAELYITLVVVGPIIFIVMMAIFGLLPSGGLPDPVLVINIIVFIGVPVISVMFTLMLDSIVTRS